MSFDDEELVRAIVANIVNINQNVQNLESHVSKIGTSEEGSGFKEFMADLTHESHTIMLKTNKLIEDLNVEAKRNKNLAAQRDRLNEQYFAIVKRFQDVQRSAVNKERAKINTVRLEDYDLSNQHPPELTQDRVQLQEQHRRNLLELRDRQQSLQTFERDVSQLNDIFVELSRIVHEQGEMVDSIEANVENATVYVEQGNANVRQAVEYQTKARQKKIILCLFCTGLLLILGLFCYLWGRR